MNNSDFIDSSEWRDDHPTIKQLKIAHALLSKALSKMDRGQVSDFIESMYKHKIMENEFDESELEQPKLSEEENRKLYDDLAQKKRSWKWKEDLK